MKFDPQKAYPYPVLRPLSDDYKNVDFQTTVELSVGKEEGILLAKVSFAISSEEIIKEIDEGRAAYFVVFACRNTYLRRSFMSKSNTLEVTLSLKDLRDEVGVEPYVIVINSIDSFKSPDINPEFGAGPFTYGPGHILAQDEHQLFYIDRDVFKPITSVFDLIKRENLKGAEWMVEFDQDHVQIAVSPEMKEKLDNARNMPAGKAILINSIFFAAVMQSVQNLKDGADYDGYKWAQVMKRQAHNAGIDIDSNPAYYTAERLMRLPLGLLDTYVFKGE